MEGRGGGRRKASGARAPRGAKAAGGGSAAAEGGGAPPPAPGAGARGTVAMPFGDVTIPHSWEELPTAPLAAVLDRLAPRDLAAAACVCRAWRAEAAHDERWERFWKGQVRPQCAAVHQSAASAAGQAALRAAPPPPPALLESTALRAAPRPTAPQVGEQPLWGWAKGAGGYREQLRSRACISRGAKGSGGKRALRAAAPRCLLVGESRGWRTRAEAGERAAGSAEEQGRAWPLRQALRLRHAPADQGARHLRRGGAGECNATVFPLSRLEGPVVEVLMRDAAGCQRIITAQVPAPSSCGLRFCSLLRWAACACAAGLKRPRAALCFLLGRAPQQGGCPFSS